MIASCAYRRLPPPPPRPPPPPARAAAAAARGAAAAAAAAAAIAAGVARRPAAAAVGALVAGALRAFAPRRRIAIELIHRAAIDVAAVARRLRRGRGAFGRSCRMLLGTIDARPVAVVVALPRVAVAPVDVAVSPGVDIAAFAHAHRAAARSAPRHGRAFVRPDRPRRRPGLPVRVAIGFRPVVAALHRRGSPAPVDVRALTRGAVRAGARVVGVRRAARAVRTVGRGAARVGAGARVVARADAGAAVRAVDAGAPSVGARPGVVVGRVSVGRKVPVVVGIVAAAPAPVRRIVIAAAPHHAAPGHHHAGVAGRRRERHPLVVIVFFDRDVGHVMRRRAGGNRVDLLRHGAGDLPRSRRRLAR